MNQPNPKLNGVYFITHRSYCTQLGITIADSVRQALDGGCTVVQYREKGRTPKATQYAECEEIRRITERYALFIVNDNPQLAINSGADGLHIGQNDVAYRLARELLGQQKLIGVSTKTVKDSIAALKAGADHIGVGPVFPTRIKSWAPYIGTEGFDPIIDTVRAESDIARIVAIGGITHQNIDQLVERGIRCCAIIGACYNNGPQSSIPKNVRYLNEKLGYKS